MFGLEFRQVVDVLVHNDPEIVGFLVRGYIALGKYFRHGGKQYE